MGDWMRYVQYRHAVENYRVEHPGQSVGQAMFNVLAQVDADAADAVKGTPLDPSHMRGHELGDFRVWLLTRWNAFR